MLYLDEYRKHPDRLTDFLPWAAMIHPAVVLNKDGSLLSVFQYRGPDLESATPEELIYISAQLNNVLKRLEGGWALHAEAQRVQSNDYHTTDDFPDPITRAIDEERRLYFLQGHHYESHYYFTLSYLPPPDRRDQIQRLLIEDSAKEKKTSGRDHLQTFLSEMDKIYNAFSDIFPETQPLTGDALLTYLHSTISPKRHTVAVPDIPMYLDCYIADADLIGGWKPMLGDCHLRIVGIKGYVDSTRPCIFDALNQLNFEYRWSTRFLCLDKLEAMEITAKYQKLHFSKRKSMGALFQEVIMSKESPYENPEAILKAGDSEAAGLEIASDYVSAGYYTMCVVVMDRDRDLCDKKAKAVEKTINNLGYVAIIENQNAVNAWLGSLPGQRYANVRRPPITTINLAHMLPVSAVYAGPTANKHLGGPPLLYTETDGNTPYRLDLHVQDLGHSMLVGPTGAGKSVHLLLLASAFRKYKNGRVYIFDNGGSSRVLTYALGGNFYDLAAEADALSFQPLAHIDEENECKWASEWISEYLASQNVQLTAEDKKAVWDALCNLATSPIHQRTITGLKLLLNADVPALGAALTPLTLEGPFGRLFDAKTDTFTTSDWQVFEMGTLMKTASIVPAALSYIFHRIEQNLDGCPTAIYLDEFRTFLNNPIFKNKIEEWLVLLRKENAFVVFAIQSLQKLADSSIIATILDSCPTRIFLPNHNAAEEHYAKIYEAFGLNGREIEMLAAAAPKRDYYHKCPYGSRMYQLALGNLSLAFCGATSREDQNTAETLRAGAPDDFARAWLRYKGLEDYAKGLLAGRNIEKAIDPDIAFFLDPKGGTQKCGA